MPTNNDRPAWLRGGDYRDEQVKLATQSVEPFVRTDEMADFVKVAIATRPVRVVMRNNWWVDPVRRGNQQLLEKMTNRAYLHDPLNFWGRKYADSWKWLGRTAESGVRGTARGVAGAARGAARGVSATARGTAGALGRMGRAVRGLKPAPAASRALGLQGKALAQQGSLMKLIERNPLKATGVGLLGGMLLAKLLSSNRR